MLNLFWKMTFNFMFVLVSVIDEMNYLRDNKVTWEVMVSISI